MTHRSLRGLALVCLLEALALSNTADAQDRLATRQVSASTVKVTVFTSAPDPHAPWQRQMPQTAWGSGVVISGPRILTNAHVVSDHASIEVQRAGLGERYTAELEHVCHDCDLAILRVPDSRFFDGVSPLPIGTLPTQQERIDVYGFPEGGEGLSITSGIVSRVEVSSYTHSWKRLLILQVDSAINSGNSGGPAVSDGRLVGVAMQGLEGAENVGYLVPAPVIRHFLEDVDDGRYDGFPELGVSLQTLENSALRARLGLGDRKGGVLVTAVSRAGCANEHVRPGDILLELDGVPVRADGKVDLDGLDVESIVMEHRAQVGQELSVTLLRSGKLHEERVRMMPLDPLVELGEASRGLPYRIFAGFVFQPLTLRYLQAFEEPPTHLWRYFEDPPFGLAVLGINTKAEPRDEVVVLTGVLSSELTRGYEMYEDEVVHAVDGVPVRSLEHLSSLLDQSGGEFVNLTLERGGMLTVRRDLAVSRSAGVLTRYAVPSDRSAELAVPAAQAPAPASAR